MNVDELVEPRVAYFTTHQVCAMIEEADHQTFSVEQRECFEKLTIMQIKDYLEGRFQA